MLLVLLSYVKFHYENTPMQFSVMSSKNENFLLKNIDFFLIFAQNIDCEYKYPQSIFLSKY